MRKYTMPKAAYISLVLLLISLCVGYTYAYFSAFYERPAQLELGYVSVVWYDQNYTLINGTNNVISVGAEKLSSDGFSKILALGEGNETRNLTLRIGNKPEGDKATVASYCRIKIDASYTPSGSDTSKPCGDQWIQLAYKGSGTSIKLLTQNGWFYHDGYYYWGNGTTKQLSEFWIASGERTVNIADYLYLAPTVDADVFGSSISIKLKVEAIQTTNGAVSDPGGWGVNW